MLSAGFRRVPGQQVAQEGAGLPTAFAEAAILRGTRNPSTGLERQLPGGHRSSCAWPRALAEAERATDVW